MDLANPVKLLWRVGLIFYGLSGGPPDSQQPTAVKDETRGPQATALAKSRHERKARIEKPTREQLQREILLLEEELEFKRSQLKLLELKAKLELEFKRKEVELLQLKVKLELLNTETNQNAPVNPQPFKLKLPVKPKSRQLLDDFQHRASVERLELRDSIQRGGRPIDGGKGWRVDLHGVIRDRFQHPIGSWGVDDDSSTPSRAR